MLQKTSEKQTLEHAEEEELRERGLIGMRKKGYEVPQISFCGDTDRKQRKRKKGMTCNNCTQLEPKHRR